MFKRAGVLFFYTLTPLHPGSGASVAAVDLPIQRERHTNFPIMQSSGVKGALRDLAGNLADNARVEVVFGPETDRASDHGGALAPTDARVLLFPVRSVQGVFAWITCPEVVEHLKRDLTLLKKLNSLHDDSALKELESLDRASASWALEARQACAPPNSNVVLPNDKIVLEDFCFELVNDEDRREQVKNLAGWLAGYALPEDFSYWQEKLRKDLVVINDDAFKEFVEMSTEVVTRIKLGETGTVDQGPWDEEHLPAETLLYSLALATKPKKEHDNIKSAQDVLRFLREELVGKVSVMQFGGDETVGKGLVTVRYFDGAKGQAQKSSEGKEEGGAGNASGGGAGAPEDAGAGAGC